jgi:hypothetical protein
MTTTDDVRRQCQRRKTFGAQHKSKGNTMEPLSFPTPAEDVQQSLGWFADYLRWASDSLGEVESDVAYALDDAQISRLAHRRHFEATDAGEVLNSLAGCWMRPLIR